MFASGPETAAGEPATDDPLRIGPATLADCTGIAEVQVSGWRTAYPEIVPADYLASLSVEKKAATWVEAVELGTPHILVARGPSGVVGWISYGHCRDADAGARAAEVWAIYVLPGAWSGGLGQRLWSKACAHLETMGFESVSVWLFPENARAIRFYRAVGLAAEPQSLKGFELGGRMLQEIRYSGDLGGSSSRGGVRRRALPTPTKSRDG